MTGLQFIIVSVIILTIVFIYNRYKEKWASEASDSITCNFNNLLKDNIKELKEEAFEDLYEDSIKNEEASTKCGFTERTITLYIDYKEMNELINIREMEESEEKTDKIRDYVQSLKFNMGDDDA